MQNQDSFVYTYTNKNNGKIYIGYHKGNENDGYTFSSEDAELNDAYLKGHLIRKIIARGTQAEMIKYEADMLTEVDARNNPMYYNKSNGGGRGYDSSVISSFEIKDASNTIQSLVNKLKNNKFQSARKETSSLKDMELNQVRRETLDRDHLQTLKSMVHADRNEGIQPEFDPILVAKMPNNKYKLIDGNHRYTTCVDMQVEFINVIILDFEKDLKGSELVVDGLGNRLNSVEKARKHATAQDRTFQMERMIDDGVDITTKDVIEYLSTIFCQRTSVIQKEVDKVSAKYKKTLLARSQNFQAVNAKLAAEVKEKLEKKYPNAFVHATHSADAIARHGYLCHDIENNNVNSDELIVCIYHTEKGFDNVHTFQEPWNKNIDMIKKCYPEFKSVKLVEIPWKKDVQKDWLVSLDLTPSVQTADLKLAKNRINNILTDRIFSGRRNNVEFSILIKEDSFLCLKTGIETTGFQRTINASVLEQSGKKCGGMSAYIHTRDENGTTPEQQLLEYIANNQAESL